MGGAFCITHAVFPISEERSKDQSVATHSAGVPARFGFIVSKAVGNAVTRNLVRRRLKSIVDRRLASGYEGVDIVFRALPAIAAASFAELEQEVNTALDRLERNQAKRLKDPRSGS